MKVHTFKQREWTEAAGFMSKGGEKTKVKNKTKHAYRSLAKASVSKTHTGHYTSLETIFPCFLVECDEENGGYCKKINIKHSTLKQAREITTE